MIPTSSQTIGPFWHGLADPALANLGHRRSLAGTVLDGDGAPVTDACIEIWQPAPAAWGRCATDARGGYAFTTSDAPVLSVVVLARGLLKPLWTRVYFEDTGDALLTALSPDRRATLLARPDADIWRWDIRLQGPDETVFLEL